MRLLLMYAAKRDLDFIIFAYRQNGVQLVGRGSATRRMSRPLMRPGIDELSPSRLTSALRLCSRKIGQHLYHAYHNQLLKK